MSRFSPAAPAAPVSRLFDLVAHWAPASPLAGSLADYADDELDDILTAEGKTRADLFAVFKGNARHRQVMALMMSHFGVDRERAARRHWAALRHAEQMCIGCTHTKRCRSWLGWGSKNDAPRIFCPCAPLFDEMAGVATGPRPAAASTGNDRRH